MSEKSAKELAPKITVIGVGGAGSNAVNNMIRSNLDGVEFIICNTDAQAIQQSLAPVRIQLGMKATQGLGAGSRPDVGRQSAEESLDEAMDYLKDTNMLFVTAGMGGGTGTGAAPVIARAARDKGILTVGVVTKPFHFEGGHRMRAAEQGIEEMRQCVDTLLVIPNQNLFRISNADTLMTDAFAMADDVLYSGVRTFTDLMVNPGLINLDFADICAVMRDMMGKAMMGTGQADGERRAVEAAEHAILCPLLDHDITLQGAQAILINITGGPDMKLFEVDEAANRIREEVDPNANIIFGATFDESMAGHIRVSVVATGIDNSEAIPGSYSQASNSRSVFGVNAPQTQSSPSHPVTQDDTPTAAPVPSPPQKKSEEQPSSPPIRKENPSDQNYDYQTFGRTHNLFSFGESEEEQERQPPVNRFFKEESAPFQPLHEEPKEEELSFFEKNRLDHEPPQEKERPKSLLERFMKSGRKRLQQNDLGPSGRAGRKRPFSE
eukprot:g8347.t1